MEMYICSAKEWIHPIHNPDMMFQEDLKATAEMNLIRNALRRKGSKFSQWNMQDIVHRSTLTMFTLSPSFHQVCLL